MALLDPPTPPPAPPAPESTDPEQPSSEPRNSGVTRRTFLRVGAVGTAAVGLYGVGSGLFPSLRAQGFLTPDGVFDAASTAIADDVFIEVFPTSPLVLSPFTQYIVNPQVLRPTTLDPAPTKAKQTSLPNPGTTDVFQQHQIWVDEIPGGAQGNPLLTYDVPFQVSTH